MASYTLLKNTSILIDLPVDIADQGWTISEGIAYHSGCNSGYIQKQFDFSKATEWTFRYEVLERTSGTINIVVDGQVGLSRNAVGTYEETFNVTGTNKLVRFFSTGINALKYLKVFETNNESNAVTLAFNEGANRWVTYYSWKPDFMIKFGNDFFSSIDGQLWEHNVNPIRNNYYNEQSYSSVTFIVNIEYKKKKLFWNFRLDGKGNWYCPEMTTEANDQFPNGMTSRLSKNNLKSIDGVRWADILNDLNDPKFASIVDPVEKAVKALYNGRKMQGGQLTVELRNDDITEARLSSVETYYVDVERSF